MHKIWTAVTLVAVVLVTTPVAEAHWKKKVRLPSISSVGVTRNFNSTATYGEVELFNLGTIIARATAEGVEVDFDPFGVTATVYDATGLVFVKFVDLNNLSSTVKVYGRVVCMANLGAASDVDGDDPRDAETANPDGDVWEIRFQITKVIGGDPLPGFPIYGSFFVQDNGRADFADESFAANTLTDPACANNPFFGLEPHLFGTIKVKD